MIYALEGLRGIAALAVALYHGWGSVVTTPFLNAWVCVDLFFVISGFVMAHVYRDQLGSGAQVASFAIRRFGRLYPLHLATLLAFIGCELVLQLAKPLAAALGYGTSQVNLNLVESGSLLSNLLLLHGMGLPGERVYNNASWSISTEIWAYALFAATALILRGWLRMLAWLVLAVIGLLVIASVQDVGGVNSGVYFFRCIYGFFLGALMTLLRFRPSAVFQVLAAAASVAVLASMGQVHELRFVAAPVFAALVLSLSADSGPVAALLRLPCAQMLGRLSYSIYMTHSLVLIFLNPIGSTLPEPYRSLLKALYVALVLVVSMFTYRTIEQPWRRRFQGYAKRSRAAEVTPPAQV